MKNWTIDDMPDLTGKLAIVTGGNKGLGYEIGLRLASKNASLIIACRTETKGFDALKRMEKCLGRKFNADVIRLDLADLQTVRQFANTYNDRYGRVDILINNAGVVNLKTRQENRDGHEMHMATNHYGHFVLTVLLLPSIKRSESARVVTMSSGGYRSGTIDFDDLDWKRRKYSRGKSYGDSKLANLLFMAELDRLFVDNGVSAISVGAHPGLSATERQQTIGIGGWLTKWLAQPVEIGALPALRAATDTTVEGRQYFGPQWFIRGHPTLEKLKPVVYDEALGRRLWEKTEEITGVKFQF